MESTRIIVGRIGRPHGIRGDVTVEVRTDDPDVRFAPGSVLLTEPAGVGPLRVTKTGRSGQVTLLHFEGIDDRTAAESLRGTLMQVEADDRPEDDDPDSFYDDQLIGLRAIAVDGRDLGVVTDVMHAPASSVLTVRQDNGPDELVPFVSAIVPDVDLAAGTLTIDPPNGMFEPTGA